MAERKILTHVNLNQNELRNAVIQVLASAPTSPTPKQGQLYYNSTNKKLYRYDGTQWICDIVALASAATSTAISATQNGTNVGSVTMGTTTQTTYGLTVDGSTADQINYGLNSNTMDALAHADSAVQDVQINGTTIVNNSHEANIPLAADNLDHTTSTTGVIAGLRAYDGTITNGVISLNTKTATGSDNKIVTEADIASLSGAMHYMGGMSSNNDWPSGTIQDGDTYVVTADFTHGSGSSAVYLEAGDMVVFESDGDFTVVQTNMTIGVNDGQIAENDGALTANKVVYATANGIATDSNVNVADILTTATNGTASTTTSTNGVVTDVTNNGHTLTITHRDLSGTVTAQTNNYITSISQDKDGKISISEAALPAGSDRTIVKVGSTEVTANHLASTPEDITFAGDTLVVPAADASTKTISYTHADRTGGAISADQGTVTEYSESPSTAAQSTVIKGVQCDRAGHITTVTTGTLTANTIPADYNGTGTTASTTSVQDVLDKLDARLDQLQVHKYAEDNTAITVSGGEGTWTVTHNLNDSDVVVSVREISSQSEVYCEVIHTSANVVTIKINSDSNIAAETYRVTVIK